MAGLWHWSKIFCRLFSEVRTDSSFLGRVLDCNVAASSDNGCPRGTELLRDDLKVRLLWNFKAQSEKELSSAGYTT